MAILKLVKIKLVKIKLAISKLSKITEGNMQISEIYNGEI